MASKHIAIIGAGIAGLTAAYRLQQVGHAVTVLETGSNVGGRMITIHWNGLAIDPGAEFVTGADQYLLELVRQLGVADKLVNYSQQQTGFDVSVMRDGTIQHVNFMSIGSYLGWKGVSLGARLSMLKLLPYLLRYGRVDAYHPELAPGEDRLNMEQFFSTKINAEMFEYWAQPTMDVFCGYTSEDLSAKMMLLMYGKYLSQKLYTFEGGIGFLPNTLADRLTVDCQATVTRIRLRGVDQGVELEYQAEGRPRKLDADRVIVAIPGDAVLPLFENPPAAWQAFFPQVRFTRVGIVYHLVEGDDPVFDEGGIMFPRREPWRLSALGWKRRPDGRVLVMSDLKAHLYDPAMPDEALKESITAEMVRAVPAFEGHIHDQMVFRWARKVPAFRVGYLEALKAFKNRPRKEPVDFCGDYLIGANAGSALASGWECAERLIREM